MDKLNKAQRKELSRLAGVAYERELGQQLSELEQSFQDWRRGVLDAFELERTIHEFHQGPARDLYKQYEMGADVRLVVARAVRGGLLKPSEVEPEVLAMLGPTLEFFDRVS